MVQHWEGSFDAIVGGEMELTQRRDSQFQKNMRCIRIYYCGAVIAEGDIIDIGWI